MYILPTSKWGRSLALVAVAVFLCAAGCAKTGKVSGTVSFEGKPLPGGHISYVSSSAATASKTDEIDENGHYTLDAPIGPCKITVETTSLMSTQAGAPPGMIPPGMDPNTKGPAGQKM